MEERMGDVEGDFQGGAIDIKNMDDVEDWGAKMKEIRDKLHQRKEVVND
jgi:cobaltochelatase CobN